ncbi:MAG TPA: HEAT repeat domain-containing protein, partial [Polyangiales bacterium]|nr:HEAT repeat domain-containing protein [Polyangiales bacterium]
LFDRHLYEKGGLVLHMLRREVGDDLFFAAVRSYLERHAHGLVETLDLQRAFEDVSGRSFERFFDQWVFRPGHPDLKVKIAYEDGQVVVSVRQQQKAPEIAIFECDFEIEIAISEGQRVRHKKRMTSSQDVLVVPLERRPAYVAFDPEMRVLGSLQIEAPGDFQRKQLEHGGSAYLRLSAAEGLAKRGDPESIAALAKCLANAKEAWMVRAEAARALGRTRAEAAFERLREQVQAQHPKVRRSVATALGSFRTQAALEALRPLADHDESYLVEAEAARALGRTRQKGALSPLLGLLQRDSWSDVVRSGALDGLATLRDEDGVDAVTERTRYGHPTRGRRAAILALAELGEGKRTRDKLELLLDDPDPHVRSDVVSALLRFGDPRCRTALRRALDQELDGRVLRRIREALRDLGETNTERKRVADEIEGLRGEVGELKARLAKLEAKAPTPPPKPAVKAKPAPQAKRPSKAPPKTSKPSKRPAAPRSKRRG